MVLRFFLIIYSMTITVVTIDWSFLFQRETLNFFFLVTRFYCNCHRYMYLLSRYKALHENKVYGINFKDNALLFLNTSSMKRKVWLNKEHHQYMTCHCSHCSIVWCLQILTILKSQFSMCIHLIFDNITQTNNSTCIIYKFPSISA